MQAIKAVCFAFLILMAGVPAVRAQSADTPENRKAAAARYAATFDFNDQMTRSLEAIAQSLPPEKRDEFVRQISSLIDFDEYRRFLMGTLVTLFNTDELNRLADFYGTPEGQSILKKMPQMMSALMPYMQQQMIKAIQRYKDEQMKKRAGPDKS